MNRFIYNKILFILILIGFFAASFISYQRAQVEKANKTVDLTVDYEDLLYLADSAGVPRHDVLQRAKEVGFTSLAVYETSFKKFKRTGKVSATVGADIIKDYKTGQISDASWKSFVESGKITESHIYITGNIPEVFKETKEDLILRLGKDRVISHAIGGNEVLEVKDNYETFEKMNLGLPTDEMKNVNDEGFMVLARPSNYADISAEKVHKALERLNGINVSEIVFSGKESLGATTALDATVEEFKNRNLNLGLIEGVTQLKFYHQEGSDKIVKDLGYDKVVRLYSIPRDEMQKIKMDVAVERWANTTEERNIRIDHLRIFETPAPGKTLLETNFEYFQKTADILRAKGFKLGKADTFESYYPNRFLRALVVIGTIAAVFLLISLLSPKVNAHQKALVNCFIVVAVIFAIPILIGAGSKIRVLSAFMAANIFPVLAVTQLLDFSRKYNDIKRKLSLKKLLILGCVSLIIAACISMMGAVYLSGALSDIEYFLEFEIYRGIKLTFILPLILVSLVFLSRYSLFEGKVGITAQLKEFLNMNVKVKTLVIAGAILLAGLIFIARSGHTLGMPVSSTELQLRAFLEQTFSARPRSKEIFIGHPAFLLAIFAWGRRYSVWLFFALVVIGTIGLGSMVETFAHMRTPFVMSVARGVNGIILGGVLGVFAIIFAWICERFYKTMTTTTKN